MFASLIRCLIVAMVMVATVAPCSAQQAVTVFAAASLQDSLKAIGDKFTAETAIPVRFSFAASSTLAKQIEQGAPADLFASADIEWMEWLEQRHLVKAGTRIDLLANRLVMVASADSKLAEINLDRTELATALGDSRLAVGEVSSVPAGRYAKSALEKLGLWAQIAPRLAQTENVRAALVLVARGEANLGIVYETDAKVEPRVKIVAVFPEASHPAIVYPFALTTTGGGEGPARLLAYLRGPTARAVFVAQGFTVLAPPRPAQ